MNTVKIGDDFENKAYDLIEKALNNKEFGLIPEQCKIFRKKRYPSFRRKKGIVFDLAIEVTPPKADRPTLLYLVECKKYSSKIPVDDVALFASYISEIDGYAIKGVFITNNKLQSGAIEEIGSHGMMLIEVDEDEYTIVLYKNKLLRNQKKEETDFDDEIRKLIENALLPTKINGLKRLSSARIDDIACRFLNEFNPNILENALATPLTEIAKYLKDERLISLEYSNLNDDFGNNVLGFYDLVNHKILIDNSIINTSQYPFIFAHEIGHYILHSNLKVNQVIYNNFKDVHFNFFQQSYALKNDKNWIEWQANCFASCLLMPKNSIILRLIAIQKELGISKQGSIFLDNQYCNKKDYMEIVNYLSNFFGVGKISIEYRLNDLGLIFTPKKKHNFEEKDRELLRKLSLLKNWD